MQVCGDEEPSHGRALAGFELNEPLVVVGGAQAGVAEFSPVRNGGVRAGEGGEPSFQAG